MKPSSATWGASVLEVLTTGMYGDSKIIYREYIQNACDQIDKAVELGILRKDEGIIDIEISKHDRTISISDNATGIKADEFEDTLVRIADSDKKIGQNKGHRGIGKLCGLAYCQTLVFTSTYKGENVVSVLQYDAKKMRELIAEHTDSKKHTADDVLRAISTFERIDDDNVTDEHYFKVELIGINEENHVLLDKSLIRKYLSFVVPVPYQSSFHYRTKIYDYAKNNGLRIDEYKIMVNAEEIFKEYKTYLKMGKDKDEVYDVEFKEIKDSNGALLAWAWIGVTRVSGQMSQKINPMRCIRLRKENIQIGNEGTLSPYFTEERFNGYFIGEVFVVSSQLIPNSQRDSFNENPTRLAFFNELSIYFKELSGRCRVGSDMNAAETAQNSYEKLATEFKEKCEKGMFVNPEQRATEREKVEKAAQKAEEKRAKVEKHKGRGDPVIVNVITWVESERIEKKHPKVELSEVDELYDNREKPSFRTDGDVWSRFSRKERKLINQIFGIIVLNRDYARETLIKKIEEEFK